MITFVAISVVICCGLIIFIGTSLSSKLNDISHDVVYAKECVNKTYAELPYNSWFMNTYKNLDKKLDDINVHLTTEIACLATKNNEDIKRVKGEFQQWDMIEYDGEYWIIYKVDRDKSAGLVSYSVYNCFGELRVFNDKELAHSTFIKHTKAPFVD